jgi:sulfate adenylyltransferase
LHCFKLSSHGFYRLAESFVDTSKPDNQILIAPYGNELINLVVAPDEALELRKYAETLPSVILSHFHICDLELLSNGALSPLDRFMGEADYKRVLREMRLTSGHVFPIPITLPISDDINIGEGQDITLRNSKNEPLAIMTVHEKYGYCRDEYLHHVLNSKSARHPLMTESVRWGARNISGPIRVLALPRYYDFPELRLTPRQVRSHLTALGNRNVVAFQTRNPLHRAHEEITKRAMEATRGILLMHPVVGQTKPGDIDHYSRVRAYKTLTEKYYPQGRFLLALLPLAMRFAGPREALWHAIIRRNFGANHFIVGRNHASPGSDEHGRPFYEPYEAQDLVESMRPEIGINVIRFEDMVYLPRLDRFVQRSEVADGEQVFHISGTSVREEFLNKGRPMPEWFMRKEVARVLEEAIPKQSRQGVCIWFTGLSGAGKSTTAEILTVLLLKHGRKVTLLDGDIVRTHLSAGLGFDMAGRYANIRRIGFVAAEIVKHGGTAVCAAISPYANARAEVRGMVGEENFVEVFVSTPLEICEERDPKGLYARARRGEIKGFTGVDDVYEPPTTAEIVLETIERSAEENAQLIIDHLMNRGFLDRE